MKKVSGLFEMVKKYESIVVYGDSFGGKSTLVKHLKKYLEKIDLGFGERVVDKCEVKTIQQNMFDYVEMMGGVK